MNTRGWEAWETFKKSHDFSELLSVVRDLAHDSPCDRELSEICKYCYRTCGHWERNQWNTGRNWIDTMTVLDSHAEDCLWRRAREVLNDDSKAQD